MKFFKGIGLLVIGGLLAAGCGNDFLDIKPTGSKPVDKNMIKTNAHLRNAVNGAYTYLEYYRYSSMLHGDVMGDDLQSCLWNYRMELFYDLTQRSVNYTNTTLWTRLYSTAYDINTVLAQVPNIENPDEETEALVAELRFIRALVHWDASLRYGPLPSNLGKGKIKQDALGVMITDKLPEDIHRTYYRDKVKDVFDFMIREMEECVGKLPKAHRNAYLNYWAGRMFMARLYLYTEQWDKAFQCAKEVIDDGGYTLYTREQYVKAWQQAYTSESIFEMPTTDADNGSWDGLSYFVNPDGYWAVMASMEFMRLKEADPEDVRFGVLEYGWGDWLPWDGSDWDECYFISGKYPGRDGNPKVCNPKIFRLSEAYLIAAEAALRGSEGMSAGSPYLSELRRNRTTTDPDKYDAGYDLDDVLYERRLELLGEGHRAFDLWRNQRPVIRYDGSRTFQWSPKSLSEIAFDDYRVLLPIAVRELELMSAEDRATQQNPGYGLY